MIHIQKPKDRTSAVKLYADVPSASRPGTVHKVSFIRKPGMKRWVCTCEDQAISRTAKRQNCRHIKSVRASLEAIS